MAAVGGIQARRMLSDEVYEGIRELVFDQHFAPGQRLVIDQLARRLGVSPTPVREALARLESDQVVVKEPHKGYSVAPMLDSQSFLALYEMRLVIEPAAARLAAERAAPEQVKAMRAALKKMDAIAQKMKDMETAAHYREYRAVPELDVSFHEAIAKASGNPFLYETVARLRPQQQTARIYSNRGVPDLALAVVEHHAILDAIVAANPDEAGLRMREHLNRARTFLFNLLNPDPSS
jgi:DNA-binding GntR family transcriptional regulator